jgi:hypothetical protein
LFGLTLEEKITKVADTATDKEIVELITPLLRERITAGVGFVTNEDDLVLGYRAYLVVGSLLVPSEATMLDWPYQPMPIPEALKKEAH